MPVDPRQFGGQPVQTVDPAQFGGQPVHGQGPAYDTVTDQGAPFQDRLGMSFKLSQEGKANYLAEKYGPDNVRIRGENIDFRPDGKGAWRQVDESGFSMGDIADVAPEAIITAATLPVSANPAGQGAIQAVKQGAIQAVKTAPLAAGASAVNQAVGYAMPGQDNLSLGDRAQHLATDVVLEGTGAFVGGVGTQALNRLRPSNVTATGVNRLNRYARRSKHTAEGDDLANELNVNLSPGARTGNKAQVMAENMARQSIFSRNAAFQADKQVGVQFLRYVDNQIDNLTDVRGAEAVGTRIRQAHQAALRNVLHQQQQAAKVSYGRVRALAGGEVPMQMNNTIRAIDDMIAEYSGRNSPEARGILKYLEGQRNKYIATTKKNIPAPKGKNARVGLGMTGRPYPTARTEVSESIKPVTLSNAMADRSYLGRKAGGEGNLFNAKVDRSNSRTVSKRLFKAMSQDFEDAASGLNPRAAEAFQRANAEYMAHAKSIEALKKSPLGSLIGEDLADDIYGLGGFPSRSAEQLAERALKLKPSQMRLVARILEKDSPETLQAFRGYVLDQALDKSQDATVSEGMDFIPFNPVKYLKGLPNERVIRELYSPQDIQRFTRLENGLRRWADKSGYNFSGTAPANEALGVINGLLSGGKAAMASAGGKIMGARQIAYAMQHPKAADMLIELTQVRPGTRRAAELIGAFSALVNAPESEVQSTNNVENPG